MTAEGVHGIGCSATDRVGNTGSAGIGTYKLDSRAPVPSRSSRPHAPRTAGTTPPRPLHFDCQDPEPGSGVDQPATGGGTLTDETAGTDFTSGGCNDIAGNAVEAGHRDRADRHDQARHHAGRRHPGAERGGLEPHRCHGRARLRRRRRRPVRDRDRQVLDRRSNRETAGRDSASSGAVHRQGGEPGGRRPPSA